MNGVEIDMVCEDTLSALELYKRIFDVEPVEVGDYPKGQNEVVFTLYGVRFHMLDENADYGLKAPDPDHPNSIWFNVFVSNIEETFSRAIDSGCTQIQAITYLPDHGMSNAMFKDCFGYIWLLHEIHREANLP